MAGVKGKGGPRRLPVAHHVLKGNYRPDRHGPLPSLLGPSGAAVAAFSAAPAPPLPADLIAGLGTAGAALVRELWNGYEFTAASRPLLRLLGEQADRLDEARVALRRQPLIVKAPNGTPIPHPMLRLEQRAVRNLMDLLKQMHLEGDT